MTEILRGEVKNLNLADPLVDLRAQIKAGSYKFLGVSGFVYCAPLGVTGYQPDLLQKYGVRCIPGTSDALENREHAALMKAVTAYATSYNSALASYLKTGNVP
jgi:hypothetical protein